MSCLYCNGTGRMKEIIDREEFDRCFDYYDKMGQFSMDYVYEKAAKSAGYRFIPCPHCNPQDEQNND